MKRRAFLARTASALGLSACGTYSPELDQPALRMAAARRCDATAPGGPLRVDMHCHLLNLQDVSAGPFVVRRLLDYDEAAFPGLDAAAGLAVNLAAEVLKVFTASTERETGRLRSLLEQARLGDRRPPFADPTRFCDWADANQRGFIRARGPRQLTGMFSKKTRNAARLSEVLPDMDLFLPSIVDLYDDRYSMTSTAAQIDFYEALNLATAGRFVPIVSYNPQRQYSVAEVDAANRNDVSYLAQVKDAVLNRGFVGVKLHASSGFSPWNNLQHGCTNTATQIVLERDEALFARFTQYDRLMTELFAFCGAHDVAVLTHGSNGITANRRCMRGDQPRRKDGAWHYPYRRWGRPDGEDGKDRLAWTNSPAHWNQVSKAHGVNVVISHFADAFDKSGDTRRPGHGRLRASPWLDYVARQSAINPRLHVDISIITEFFERVSDDPVRHEIRPGYQAAFDAVLQRYPHLPRQLLYGSDWHMPDTARVGGAYAPLIERLLDRAGLSAADRAQIMGLRAARVFGLTRGAQTRRRLEEFYRREGRRYLGRAITPQDVAWMAKLP